MLVALVAATSALATLPGRNGIIVFQVEQCDAGCDDWIVGCLPSGRGLADFPLASATYSDPAFAPGGRSLAVEGGLNGIEVVNTDGTGKPTAVPRKKRRGRDFYSDPTWSPDGRHLIASFRRGRQAALVRLTRDGRILERVSPSYEAGAGLSPDWSARGEVAYETPTGDPAEARSGGISVIRPGSGAPRLLTSGADRSPSWSPDGKTVAFVRVLPDGETGIFRIGRDGRGERLLGEGRSPVWSPDGKYVLFLRDIGRTRQGLFLMKPDATGVRRIGRASNPEVSWYNPAWQPLPR